MTAPDPKKVAEQTQKAEEFVKELRALSEKYYGELNQDFTEPFGAKLRQLLPLVEATSGGNITTTKTLTIPWDTDPPDSD
jgi:hypothetical protein